MRFTYQLLVIDSIRSFLGFCSFEHPAVTGAYDLKVRISSASFPEHVPPLGDAAVLELDVRDSKS